MYRVIFNCTRPAPRATMILVKFSVIGRVYDLNFQAYHTTHMKVNTYSLLQISVKYQKYEIQIYIFTFMYF